MCGILGSINIDNTADFLHEISHRGPDANGKESLQIGEHNVHLLHHRLSIVDLSEAGKQPMSSYDQKNHIVFNGEIYNHQELKKELNAVSFRGHSDTETILNFFSKNSILENLHQLNGIFAIAYLDKDQKQFHLARDRFGIKPLYYFFDGKSLLFSSELRPLKACLNPDIDKSGVLNSQKMRYTPSPQTVYKNISKVEPGQIISFDLAASKIELHKKYFVRSNKVGGRKGDFKQLTKEYGDLFEKAVERQLMADVDLGVLLSGGVDSALVAAIAQQKSKQKIKAFTVGFEGDHSEIDEIGYAQETADILGLNHYIKKIGSTHFLDAIERTARIVEEPIATTSIIPMYFLSELAASHVKVVLSGQGADEPLGGYDKYKALPYLEKARVFKVLSPLLKILSPFYSQKENLRRFINAISPKDMVGSWMEFNSISSSKDIEKLLHPGALKSYMAGLEQQQQIIHSIWQQRSPKGNNVKDIFLYNDVRTMLADDLLMYTDKITMNFGLECRVPILDNDLVAFIESLDSSYKFNTKQGKIIHKAFAKEYLPSSIVDRKKLGFKSPTEKWFKEKTNEIESAFDKNAAFKEFFNFQNVKKLLKRHREGENLEKQIFLLLSIGCLFTEKTGQSIL